MSHGRNQPLLSPAADNNNNNNDNVNGAAVLLNSGVTADQKWYFQQQRTRLDALQRYWIVIFVISVVLASASVVSSGAIIGGAQNQTVLAWVAAITTGVAKAADVLQGWFKTRLDAEEASFKHISYVVNSQLFGPSSPPLAPSGEDGASRTPSPTRSPILSPIAEQSV